MDEGVMATQQESSRLTWDAHGSLVGVSAFAEFAVAAGGQPRPRSKPLSTSTTTALTRQAQDQFVLTSLPSCPQPRSTLFDRPNSLHSSH
jgi:hypothetical protein